MDFPAHIRLEVMGRTVQTVETHCRHCAAYAAAAAPRGMGQTAFLAGCSTIVESILLFSKTTSPAPPQENRYAGAV